MKHSLGHNAMYNFIYQLLNVLFSLISVGHVSRVLAPEGMGSVTIAQNIVSYFVMFAALGIPSYGTREIARIRKDEAGRNAVFSELLVINGLATTVCLTAYLFLSRYLLPEDSGLRWAVGLELIFCYVSMEWLYQGMEEYGYITVRNVLVKAASLAALLLLVKKREDYIIYAVIHCMSIGANSLCNVFHARRFVKLKLSGLNLKRHMAPVLWLLMGSVTAGLYSKVDVTMLGVLAEASSVAFYVNAHKVISMILGLVTALSAVFLPRLSYLYAADRNGFQQCLTDGLHMILLLAVPACAGIYVAADNLTVCLFGQAFLPGASVLRILSVFTVIKGVGDLLCYQTLISSGNERYLIRSRLVAGIANVILNGVLIPEYVHCGAAIASVISELLVNGLLLSRTRRIAALSVSFGFCACTVVSTAVMAMGVSLLQNRIGTGMWSLTLTVSFGMLLYGLLQAATNGQRIRRMWNSIRKNT